MSTLEVGIVIFSSLLMKVDRRMLGDGNREGIWEKMTNATQERENREKYNHQVDLPPIWSLPSFLGWETFSRNQLNFKGCFRAMESDFMGSYQAVVIGSVILPFKQILTLDGWVVVWMTFMVLCKHLLIPHCLWLWFYRIPLLGSGIACVGQRFPVEERDNTRIYCLVCFGILRWPFSFLIYIYF